MFEGCTNLKSVTYPSGVKFISWKQFDGQNDLEPAGIEKVVILSTDCDIVDDAETFPEPVVIYGYTSSTAQAYAEKYGRQFVSIGEAPIKPASGDANGDGLINVADAVAILQYVANSEKYPIDDTASADCDGIDGITGMDAVAVQMYDAKIIDSLPL